MDEIDMVFVGADGVVESGGIINMMGTYQIALVAKSMNKPVYVAAESYKVGQQKFALYVLTFNLNLMDFAVHLVFNKNITIAHLKLEYLAFTKLKLSFGICSLLGSIPWTRKTWSLPCVQLILGCPFLRKLRLKHLQGIIHLLNISLYFLQIWVY